LTDGFLAFKTTAATGNRQQAACALGMSGATIYRKISDHGIA
jgi:transcriptional regulator of acetoin/glycerol metabolism